MEVSPPATVDFADVRAAFREEIGRVSDDLIIARAQLAAALKRETVLLAELSATRGLVKTTSNPNS